MTDKPQPEAREFTMSQYASKDDMIGAMRKRIAELESELEAVGAGGVQALSAASPPAEQQAAPKAAPGGQNTVPAEWLEQAYREGWAACRDAETIGEEAEDWAFGNSTANSRMIDAQQAAPQQEAHHLTQALTDPENQPNQYGVEFGMSGQQMHFKIGNQLFRLAYEPDDQEEFEFMKRMLVNAFSTFTPDVKTAPQQEAQEPVAWLVTWVGGGHNYVQAHASELPAVDQGRRMAGTVTPLYTAPQPAPAPLSDDVVKDAARYAAVRDGSIEHDDILKTVKDPGKWEQPYAVLLRGVALDSAIDAALAAQGATP